MFENQQSKPVFSRSSIRIILIILGTGFLCFAAGISDAELTKILLPESNKNLSWGIDLFRLLSVFHGIILIGTGLKLKRFSGENTTAKSSDSLKIGSKIGNDFYAMIFMTVLTVVAAALRFWQLKSDLWVDEVFTLLDFVRFPLGEIVTKFPSQNQHLLYSILAHVSTQIFGESAWALRLPAVLFGIGSIWALFFLCRSLTGVSEALASAALMTVSYHHIWFSQNARGYTGLLFFTLLATWLWFEALKKNDFPRWFFYGAAIVCGMWVHMTMAFVAASHAVVYVVFLLFPKLSGDKNVSLERKVKTVPLIVWILSATATLQIYALALPEFLSVGLHEESKNSEWTNPLWVLTETLQNLSIGFAGTAVVLIGAALVIFGWTSFFRINRRAALLMVLPTLWAGAMMIVLGHNLFPRFFFFATGFGIIIFIHGAIEIPKILFAASGKKHKQNVLRFAEAGLIVPVIIASLLTVPRNYSLPKQDFSGAKVYVENSLLPGDEIVAVGLAGDMYKKYFSPKWSVAENVSELENFEQKSTQVKLIYTLSPELEAFHPDLWQKIERDYETVKVFPGTLNGGEIFVCRNRNSKIEEVKNDSNQDGGQTAINISKR